MFEKIKDFIGRMKNHMFNDIGAINNAAGESIATSSEMLTAIKVWADMMTNKDGLGLAAAISKEMARLITIELKAKVSGGARGEYLDKALNEVVDNIRVPMEFGCGLGGLIFKPYISNGNLVVDFIKADSFFPLSFDSSGRITSAIFLDRVYQNKAYYTRVEKHTLNGTSYKITNTVYKSLSRDYLGALSSLGDIPQWQDLAETMDITNVRQPLFGYFKPANANLVDPSSPLGVSVFSGAEKLIEDADNQYKKFLWEFESGERAVIANSMAFKRDKKGKIVLPDKKLYKTLDVEDVDFFKEWTPTLRQDNFIKGLDRIFRQIEFSCGLAYGTLSDVQTSDKTAEEIKASKQRSYATVSDNQKALKTALSDLIYAMDVWCTLYNLAPICEYSTNFDFDDSIVADRKTEFTEKQALVASGIMQKWEFRMWYFGEDEEAAKAAVSNEFDEVPEL